MTATLECYSSKPVGAMGYRQESSGVRACWLLSAWMSRTFIWIVSLTPRVLQHSANLPLGVSIRVVLDEFDLWMRRLAKHTALPDVGGPHAIKWCTWLCAQQATMPGGRGISLGPILQPKNEDISCPWTGTRASFLSSWVSSLLVFKLKLHSALLSWASRADWWLILEFLCLCDGKSQFLVANLFLRFCLYPHGFVSLAMLDNSLHNDYVWRKQTRLRK